MCFRLYRKELQADIAFQYGREGQEQHGVDIALRSPHREWTGVQCKLKTDLLGSKLTQSELIEEQEKSRRFDPALTRLIIATTCKKDKKVQDMAVQISTSFQSRHPVEVKFWSDIETLLEAHSDVAGRFYPERFAAGTALIENSNGNLEVTMDAKGWRERLAHLLTHPVFVTLAGGQLHALRTILCELIENALNRGKGGASRVIVELLDRNLSIRDDGATFDSLNASIDLEPRMQGIRAVRRLVEGAGADLTYRYIPKDPIHTRFNSTEIQIQAGPAVPRNPCSASSPATYLMDRVGAMEFVDNLSIPASCETFSLRFEGDTFLSYSAASEMIERLLRRLGGRKLHIRIGSEARGLFDLLLHQVGNNPDVSVTQE